MARSHRAPTALPARLRSGQQGVPGCREVVVALILDGELAFPFLYRFADALREAFTNGEPCQPTSSGAERAAVAAVTYDVLGDDLDGAAAMLDDAEHLGMF